ncbi:hypothetical protein QJS04_geneDACA015214 [Acorus gramineus]|uniref:Uncharacterized protein n=1 Tax=Acorus gramineus TaxID=55184 RepID=A0AAV9BDT4_ACOGR|nr:hypothetical protein QJS04_geneDACA015214 [Acorus gramineus]
MRTDHGLLVYNLHKQIALGDPPAWPSSPSMPHQGITRLSVKDMDISEFWQWWRRWWRTPPCHSEDKETEENPSPYMEERTFESAKPSFNDHEG